MPLVARTRSGRARIAARLASAALLALAASPAAAQIRTAPPPVVPKPSDPIRERILQPLPVDLIIESVTIQDVETPAPATTARVVVRNQGTADAVFPAGSILARGDAAQSGGVAFAPMTAPAQFTVAAGGTQTLTLSVGDVCAAGNPGTVTFRVDPGSVVPETNEANNTKSVQASSFASGDIRGVGLELTNTTAPAGTEKRPNWLVAQYPADETLRYHNDGSGPALWCPNVVLWRETATPLSAKYGLREVRNTSGKAAVIRTGSLFYESKIAGAFQPGDLPPGDYALTARMNPDGKMREPSANNVITSGMSVH